MVKSLLLRRVVKDKDKADKKKLILDRAASLLAKREFNELSMDLVARETGLAKGTLYLYFKTKEEIGLEVLKRDYMTWFNKFRTALNDGSIKSPSSLAKWVAKSLQKMPRFLKLLPLGTSILESNVSDDYLLGYKVGLADELETTAIAMSHCFPVLTPAQAGVVLVQIHIIAIGTWSHGFPNPKIKKIIANHSLKGLDFDYFKLLEMTINQLVKTVIIEL